MDVSVIYPVKDEPYLSERLKEIDAFFTKWPLNLEVILVCEPGSDFDVTALSLTKIKIQKIVNPRHIGRGPSVLKGIQSSQSSLILVASIDFSVPLAEYYSFLLELVQDPDLDAVFGNRFSAKRPIQGSYSNFHQAVHDIAFEKSKKYLNSVDPLCSFLAFKKVSFDKLKMPITKLSWFYSAEMQKSFQQQNFKVLNLPINYRASEKSKIPIVRELFRYFF